MNPALWAALGATAALFLVLVGVVLAMVLGGRRDHAHEPEALLSARADVEALRAQVQDLTTALAASQGATAATSEPVEYVITTAGQDAAAPADLPQVPERAVLSVTLGEPLVKLAALGYGVRRALSAESRHRIAFEIRRETRRARKERRRAARRTRLVRAQTGVAEEAA